MWYTPFLPLLFLLSALPLGIAAVIAENAWQGGGKRGHDADMEALGGLARALPWMLGLYLLLRLGAMAWEGKLGLVLERGEP